MAAIKWHYEDEQFNRILVRTTDVPVETLGEATKIASIATSRLAAHHANNQDDPRPDSSISITRGDVDAFVNLDADSEAAAASIQKEVRAFAPFTNSQGPVDHSQTKRKNTKKYKRIYGKA